MNKESAMQFLRDQGAPERLLHHAAVVAGVAEDLVRSLKDVGVPLAAETVLVGAVLHDAGKILHPEELHGSGHQHEEAGQRLLRDAGVAPELARVCVSHARWQEMDCSLEELVVALADKLWKGKRDETLEMAVITRVARALGSETWQRFRALDTCFETLASDGHDRLLESARFR